METYLAVTPDKLSEALKCTDRIAHAAYRIGAGGALTGRELAPRVHGGIMMLGDDWDGEIGDTAALCESIWRECQRRGYCAVVADFDRPPTPDRVELLCRLCGILRKNNRALYVPESCGGEVRQARVLVCAAISGGTLCERLDEAKCRFGDRLALDLQRLRMDFPLPCPGGEGCALDRETLREFLACDPPVFFSEDLCAKYFTRVCGCELRFVLFDDAETLMKKRELACRYGIGTVFLMYPEVEDILERLFPGCAEGRN